MDAELRMAAGRRVRDALSGTATAHRWAVLTAAGAGLVLVLMAPTFLDAKTLNIADLVLLSAIGAVALNLVFGIAGQVSIANAAFLAIGSFTAATVSGTWHLPLVPTVFIAGLVGLVVGAIVGLSSVRLKGLYLIVSTLALHYIVIYAVQVYQTDRAGPAGFTLPQATLFGAPLFSYGSWYYTLIVVVAIVVLGLRNLMRTSFGRAWLAIRSIEHTAGILGINVPRYKLLAFMLSSFLCSVQGALLAYFNGAVSYETFTFAVAVQYAAMVLVGGLGSITGAIIGAALLTSLPFVLDDAVNSSSGLSANLGLMIYGAAIVLFILFAPNGIAGLSRQVTGLARWFATTGQARRRSALPRSNGGIPQRAPAPGGRDVQPPAPSPGAGVPSIRQRGYTAALGVSSPAPVTLALADLCVTYDRVAEALHGVSIQVPRGQIVAILGPNGAGKTTTLRAISGLLGSENARVSRGRITLDGVSLLRKPPHWIARRGIAIVPERNKVFPPLTVRENLDSVPIINRGESRQDVEEFVFRLFPSLVGRLRQPAGLLSGGERQMLAVARALLLQPRVLLADELSFGVAPVLVTRLRDALREINREKGTSILLVEQNAMLAFELASYIYIMENGSVVAEGAPPELQARDDIQRIYFGLDRMADDISERL